MFANSTVLASECEAYCHERDKELHEPMQRADRWQLSREAFDRFWANYYISVHG